LLLHRYMNAERTPSLTSVSRDPTQDKRAVEAWHLPGRDGVPISLETVADLRAEAPGKVLSIYLDADARQGAASNPAWRIRLKDALNGVLDEERDREAATVLARLGRWLLERVEAELDPTSLRRGLALIATETPRRLEAFVLPQPIDPVSAWADEPLVEPLMELQTRYPRMGIAILDRWHARLVTSWLGIPVDEKALERAEANEDWREMKGTAYQELISGGATHRDRYQRRMRERTERWWDDLVPQLQRQARANGWTALAVVADEHAGVDPAELARSVRLPLVAQLHDLGMYLPTGKIAEAVARETAAHPVSA
jgi:hypothetical protein